MVPRRFINLVMKDLRVGGSYWLSRMRPDENLFYSSAMEAVATELQAKRDRRKSTCGSIKDLPSPVLRLNSSRTTDMSLDFMPFYGGRRAGGEGKIVALDSAGHSVLYDADADGAGSVEVLVLPGPNARKWHSPISLCVADDDHAQDSSRAGVIYAINRSTSRDFEALVYSTSNSNPSDSGMAWRWFQLPPPPYVAGDYDCTIQSYALLGDGKTICFSSVPSCGGFGTYCFDTATREWTKAGRSWALPFVGRALHVPQLYGLYFGFLGSNPENLVALELPSPLAPPKVLHQWRGFFGPPDQPGEWSLMDSNLLYMGNLRFCVAKFFGICLNDSAQQLNDNLVGNDMVAVLTGVEIINAEANRDKLRMIKHKTRTYIFQGCSIEAVL